MAARSGCHGTPFHDAVTGQFMANQVNEFTLLVVKFQSFFGTTFLDTVKYCSFAQT